MTAGDVVLKVTPEMLTEKADLAEETLLEVQRMLESLEQTVKRTRGYWLGSAGELHRKMYEDEKTAAEEILRRLQSHLRFAWNCGNLQAGGGECQKHCGQPAGGYTEVAGRGHG